MWTVIAEKELVNHCIFNNLSIRLGNDISLSPVAQPGVFQAAGWVQLATQDSHGRGMTLGCLAGVLNYVPSWMAHASFARKSTRDASGPFSNPSVAASLVGKFHVLQVREKLLPGTCHLPLPAKLKLMDVCSSVSQQELSWSGVQVLLPPPEVFQRTSRPLLPLLIPRAHRFDPCSARIPQNSQGHKLDSVFPFLVHAQTRVKWGEWLDTICLNKLLHKPK